MSAHFLPPKWRGLLVLCLVNMGVCNKEMRWHLPLAAVTLLLLLYSAHCWSLCWRYRREWESTVLASYTSKYICVISFSFLLKTGYKMIIPCKVFIGLSRDSYTIVRWLANDTNIDTMYKDDRVTVGEHQWVLMSCHAVCLRVGGCSEMS